MTFDAHADLATGTIAFPPSPPTSGTSLTLQSGQGAWFPTPPFYATAWPYGAVPTRANAEIVRVTNVSTDTVTIARAQGPTSAQPIASGWQFSNTVTAEDVRNIEGSTAGPLTVREPGNLGAAYTVDFNSTQQEIWVEGTLNANCTVTFANRVAGCRSLLLLTQDAVTGGWTLDVSDGSHSTLVGIDPITGTMTMVGVDCPDTSTVTAAAAGGVLLGGDIGGTLYSPVVETVLGGQTPIDLATFLGSSQVVRPSGDSSGATDAANINAALAGSNTSIYLNGNYVINATLSIPSGVTLILADAYVKLAAAANVAMIANPSYTSSATPAASGIKIRGIGRAILDYNGTNQTEQTLSLWNSCAITFVNVSNFVIEGIQFQNSQYLWMLLQVCSNGEVRNIGGTVGSTDKGLLHTDIGCSNIRVSGINTSGTWLDAVFSLNTVSVAAAGPTTPYANTLSGTARNITGISFTDILLTSSTGAFCFFADSSNAIINDIAISNVHNLYTGGTTGEELQIGPTAVDSVTVPTITQSVTGVRVNGYTFGGTSHKFCAFDMGASDFVIDNVRSTTSILSLVGNIESSMPSGYYPVVSRIKFNNVGIEAIGSSGALSKLVAGIVVQDLEYNNVTVGTATGPLFSHVSDVAGLKATIKVGTLNANPFQSTGSDQGEVSLTYDQKGTSLTAVAPSALTFKIVPPFPALAPADTTPFPIHGSALDCYAGKDPTGGAATTGGTYKADGLKWNLVLGLNSAFRPAQMYYPLLFHYDAATLADSGITNGASIAKWIDNTGNLPLLQATGGDQPTLVTADTTLNSLPSVAFNGSSQWLQNSLLTPRTTLTAWTLFLAYYWTTFAGDVLWTGLASTPQPVHYGKQTSTATSVAATSAVTSTHASIVTGTAYVGCIDVNGTTGAVGENCAAQSSLASGSINANNLVGLTLGAAYTTTPTAYAAVHIAELFAYQGVLSSGDYATVAAALAAKYSITLS